MMNDERLIPDASPMFLTPPNACKFSRSIRNHDDAGVVAAGRAVVVLPPLHKLIETLESLWWWDVHFHRLVLHLCMVVAEPSLDHTGTEIANHPLIQCTARSPKDYTRQGRPVAEADDYPLVEPMQVWELVKTSMLDDICHSN